MSFEKVQKPTNWEKRKDQRPPARPELKSHVGTGRLSSRELRGEGLEETHELCRLLFRNKVTAVLDDLRSDVLGNCFDHHSNLGTETLLTADGKNWCPYLLMFERRGLLDSLKCRTIHAEGSQNTLRAAEGAQRFRNRLFRDRGRIDGSAVIKPCEKGSLMADDQPLWNTRERAAESTTTWNLWP